MTEKQLQDAVLELARVLGWRGYHPHDSRRSAAGFPDLTLVHARLRRIIFAELKAENGRLRPEQDEWLAALQDARCEGVTVAVWLPRHWHSGAIERTLREERNG